MPPVVSRLIVLGCSEILVEEELGEGLYLIAFSYFILGSSVQKLGALL
jgi:hypothetical protein